jgi:glycosyltransferase involved in cell wall biosynthesis
MDKDIKKENKKDPIEKIAPKISVQIITKNRAKLLPLAIESALNQTYKNLEIIIVDTNSTDKTEELVKKYTAIDSRIKYFRIVENLGITKTRNFALSKSTGSYVAILDSDDFWLSEEKLEKQIDFLLKNPDYAAVGTNTVIVNSQNQKIGEVINQIDWSNYVAGGNTAIVNSQNQKNGEIADQIDWPKIKEMFLIKTQITHSSALIKKDPLMILGGYDEKYEIWEDYAVFLKLGRENKIANLPEFLTAYKKHDENVSNFNKIKNLFVLAQIIFDNRKFYPKFLTALFLVFLRILAALFKKY